MINVTPKNKERIIRHKRIRKKVFGTEEAPRLCVFRSLNYIYAQIIDDSKGVTLVSASSMEKSIKEKAASISKKEVATLVGHLIAQKALEKNITNVVFDRAGYKYHGRIKNLADGAREKGMVF